MVKMKQCIDCGHHCNDIHTECPICGCDELITFETLKKIRENKKIERNVENERINNYRATTSNQADT